VASQFDNLSFHIKQLSDLSSFNEPHEFMILNWDYPISEGKIRSSRSAFLLKKESLKIKASNFRIV
jgi:hypothetical protein